MRRQIWITIILLVQVCLWFIECVKFQPACDLHENARYGHQTPTKELPIKADTNWLFAENGDILEWYKSGKKECEAFLQKKSKFFSTEHNAYYTNSHTMPPASFLCNGYHTLYDLTGMMVWAFGPYRSCPTYSKCWFGLLSCGTYQSENVKTIVQQKLIEHFKAINESYSFIEFNPAWSIRSLLMQTRFIGQELIVPELRYYSLPDHEDVLIAQYVTSYSNDNYTSGVTHNKVVRASTIEIRHAEFYPSIFFQWAAEMYQQWDVLNLGVVFLGGNQGRCRPFMKCPYANNCCDCDTKSFVLNTPLKVQVPHAGLQHCPELFKPFTQRALPICTGKNQPGRWIRASYSAVIPKSDQDVLKIPAKLPPLRFDSHSARRKSNQGGRKLTQQSFSALSESNSKIKHNNQTLQPYIMQCDPSVSYNIFEYDPVVFPTEPVKLPKAKTLPSTPAIPPMLNSPWYHASGNPCMFDKMDEKEYGGSGHWFYAPYRCKYHFYTRDEAYQCFKALDITHIHIHGDSMARELFYIISKFLGIGGLTKEAELKDLTNRLKQKKLEFYNEGLLLTQGYVWGYDKKVIEFLDQPPYPNVIISNTALSHRLDLRSSFEKKFNETEKQFWTEYLQRQAEKTKQQKVYRIYQNMREIQGLRNLNFISNMMRQNSEFVRKYLVEEVGFVELDEYLLTMGRQEIQNPHFDGFHFMNGARQMEVIVLMNMICNEDWLLKL